MKLTTGYKKPIASSGTDAEELSSNNSYLLLAGGGHKALSDYVTVESNQTITGVKTFSLAINADITGDSDTLDGYHASAFAFIENTYGTTGNFANIISESNYIARGDLGFVGFDNSSIIVELYEATSGNSYSSSPTKIINTSDSTYGVNFRKGTYAIMHSCAAGSKLKIIVKSNNSYIKSVGIYINTGGNTISFSSTVGGITKTGSFDTWGSWHVFSCMNSILNSVTLELNTTNVNCGVIIGGFRTYITNPMNLRFPGVANSAESIAWSNITDKPTSLPANGGDADTLDNEHASAFAHIGDHNDLTAAGNEFTFASSGFRGNIWFNYRTAGGANGNITGYIFGNGKGEELGTAIHSGNYNEYAPKLDGTGATGTWGINISGNAATASSVDWSGVTNKPNLPNFVTYEGSLATSGWQKLNGQGNAPSIAIAYNNNSASWNTGTYSATMVWGCADTRGFIDCGYNNWGVTFGGGLISGSTDDSPTWYWRLYGTSGCTYILPSDSKSLAAADGSNASGTWGINISGNAAYAKSADKAQYLPYQDTRNTDYAPYSTSFATKGLSATHLKSNLVDGLQDGGEFHTSIYIYSWGDSTGGNAHNLAFTDNGNIWLRSGKSSWRGWKKVAWTSDIPTIGNGALHIKVNGTELTPEGGTFTANKSGDSTIDLANSLATRPEINTLGDKITTINTSIAGLTAATQIKNPFDDSEEGDEETIESQDKIFGNKVGDMDLRFYDITTYIKLPVYWVNVENRGTVSEIGNSTSSLYTIRLAIDLTGTTIASTVGISSDIAKYFYIRGANRKNKICGFDVRGTGGINGAYAIMSGKYLLLHCYLKLHGENSDMGSFIMTEAQRGRFNAYLCLRKTP